MQEGTVMAIAAWILIITGLFIQPPAPDRYTFFAMSGFASEQDCKNAAPTFTALESQYGISVLGVNCKSQ
jgi:hypothetical protein